MEKDNIKQNSMKAWALATRPKTLTAAAVPVMVATAIAWQEHALFVSSGCIQGVKGFNILAMILCFLFAFIMQIDANFVNDYYDCVRGNDDETRLGPKRACAQGWISLKAMRIAMVVTTLLGCAVGLPLAVIGGWEMVLVGVACVAFCFLYTTCLSYWGMGDLLVLVFFGIVPVCCTYYVEKGVAPGKSVWMASFAVGMVIDTLLIINNYRDIDNDRKAGKRTLAVFIGKKAMAQVYLWIVPISLCLMAFVFAELSRNIAIIIPFILFFFNLHYFTWKKMVMIGEGKELNKVLGMTARNIFLFGILSSLGVIFA